MKESMHSESLRRSVGLRVNPYSSQALLLVAFLERLCDWLCAGLLDWSSQTELALHIESTRHAVSCTRVDAEFLKIRLAYR